MQAADIDKIFAVDADKQPNRAAIYAKAKALAQAMNAAMPDNGQCEFAIRSMSHAMMQGLHGLEEPAPSEGLEA